MTQTAERTVPYEVYERELERRRQAERTAESQMRTINALQNEVHWLEGTIFNPAFNEVDIRLAVTITPREIRMGLTGEAPERKVWLPKLGEDALTSEKTASRHLKHLKDMGAVSYRTERDKETGNVRAYVGVLPAIERPSALKGDEATRGGGSDWKDGKRIKRCPECNSPVLNRRSQYWCQNPACMHQFETAWKPVNQVDDLQNEDEEPYSQSDRRPQSAREDDAPLGDTSYSQSDTESQSHECPHSTCIHSSSTVDDPAVAPDSDPYSQSDRRPLSALEELRALPQWVVWRYGTKLQSNGKYPKLPYDAKVVEAKSKYSCDYTDPAHWASYDQALARYQESQSWKGAPYNGVGFVFKEGGGIVGIDRDGSLLPLVSTYGERSVSGEGRHEFAHARLQRNVKKSELGIELYDHDRFFTWTGDHLPDSPDEIRDCQAEIDALFARIAPAGTSAAPPPLSDGGIPADEEELQAVFEKASRAANRAKFLKLWSGDASDYRHKDGSIDQSGADIALCRMLVFYARQTLSAAKTVPTVDALFRRSGLMRDKWDRTARVGETYGQGTIRRALNPFTQEVA